jgi:hypothetical protein
MTNTALKAQIDSQITNETATGGITPYEVGTNLKEIVNYVDQQSPIKVADALTLSATPQVLPYDVNSLSFSGGIAYLPTTDVIGKEVYAIANSNNIEIRANVGNTAKMFVTFGTFVQNVILTTNQMYRFIYIGFDTVGYWKAEQI